MSPRNSFHVADKISCRQNLTHVRAKMISCRQNAFHVAKTFSCRQKCFSCRRKINFMSPIWFHVAEKVHFPDGCLRNSRVIQVSSRRIDSYTCFTNTQDPNLQMKCVYYSVMYIQTVTRTTRGYSWHLCVCYWAWISSFKFVSIYHSILTRTTRLERAVVSLPFTVVVGVRGQPAEPSWVAQFPEHQLIVVFHVRETFSTSVLAWGL